jgi:hypothetical protein
MEPAGCLSDLPNSRVRSQSTASLTLREYEREIGKRRLQCGLFCSVEALAVDQLAGKRCGKRMRAPGVRDYGEMNAID